MAEIIRCGNQSCRTIIPLGPTESSVRRSGVEFAIQHGEKCKHCAEREFDEVFSRHPGLIRMTANGIHVEWSRFSPGEEGQVRILLLAGILTKASGSLSFARREDKAAFEKAHEPKKVVSKKS